MRFFTPELLCCEDDGAFERAMAAYRQNLDLLGAVIPNSVRRFEAEASIHDATIQRFMVTEDQVEITVKAGDLQVGYHLLVLGYGEPFESDELKSSLQALAERRAEALYDEFDVEDNRLVHRVLFTRETELHISCSSFKFSKLPLDVPTV